MTRFEAAAMLFVYLLAVGLFGWIWLSRIWGKRRIPERWSGDLADAVEINELGHGAIEYRPANGFESMSHDELHEAMKAKLDRDVGFGNWLHIPIEYKEPVDMTANLMDWLAERGVPLKEIHDWLDGERITWPFPPRPGASAIYDQFGPRPWAK